MCAPFSVAQVLRHQAPHLPPLPPAAASADTTENAAASAAATATAAPIAPASTTAAAAAALGRWLRAVSLLPGVGGCGGAASGAWLAFIGARGGSVRRVWEKERVVLTIGAQLVLARQPHYSSLLSVIFNVTILRASNCHRHHHQHHRSLPPCTEFLQATRVSAGMATTAAQSASRAASQRSTASQTRPWPPLLVTTEAPTTAPAVMTTLAARSPPRIRCKCSCSGSGAIGMRPGGVVRMRWPLAWGPTR